MKRVYGTMAAMVVAAGGVLADGGVTVKLPDVSALSEGDATALIAQLAEVNVITSNCADYELSAGEWTLVTQTGDALAKRLGLDPQEYDKTYYAPAFRLLDEDGACERIGPTARALIDRLVAMGGDTTPVSAAPAN